MIINLPNYVFIDDSTVVSKNSNNVIRSEMETGPVKTRPIQSIPMKQMVMTISITRENFAAFDTWFRVTLNWGSNFFFFNDPITGVSTRYRFFDTELEWQKRGTILTCEITLECYHGV